MIALDIVVAFGLFRLLRHVDERIAIVATASRLVQAAILTANLINPLRALGFARETAEGVPGAAEQALAAMETHALVYDIGLLASRSRASPSPACCCPPTSPRPGSGTE